MKTGKPIAQSAQAELKGLENRAVSFVEGLARLVKARLYYPEGHSIFEKVIEAFQAQLRMQFAQQGCVKLSLTQGKCMVGKLEVLGLSENAEKMCQLFFDMGLYRITFHAGVSAGELQVFISRLLEWKVHSQAAKKFTFFAGENFPGTIEIHQQQFVAGRGSEVSGAAADVYGGIGEICRTLVKSGYDMEEVMECRDFLVGAIEKERQAHGPSATPAHTQWQDVVGQLAGILDRRSLEGERKEGFERSDLNAISSIFESVEEEVDGEGGGQAINLLLSYFANDAEPKGELARRQRDADCAAKIRQKENSELRISPSQAVEEKANRERAKNIAEGKGAQEEAVRQVRKSIQAFVQENSLPGDILKKLAVTDNSEELSILFELFVSGSDEIFLETLTRRIQSLAGSQPTERERGVLVAGLAVIAQKKGFSCFYRVTKGLLEKVRRLGGQSLPFVVRLCQQLTDRHKKFAWPFLVNEAMHAGAVDLEAFGVAVRFASLVALEDMAVFQPYLEGLGLFLKKEKGLPQQVFLPEYVDGYPLYSFLLGTPLCREIGLRILEGLTEKPQDELMGVVAGFLFLDRREHLIFLRKYLFYRPRKAMPQEVEQVAAYIAAEALAAFDGENLEESQMMKMINYIGSVGGRDCVPVFERVVGEKKMGVLYFWPSSCRKAAREFLQALRKRS